MRSSRPRRAPPRRRRPSPRPTGLPELEQTQPTEPTGSGVPGPRPDPVPAGPGRAPAPGPAHRGRHDRRRRPGRAAQPRAAADPRHRARRPGDPRLVQRPGRPQARRPPPAPGQAARRRPARPGHGLVLPGARGLPGGAAVGRQRPVRRRRPTSLSLAIGLVGQWVWLRKGFFSWLPWAAAFALYPAFLSYGGWGGQERGAPPELLVTALAALLGIGVHFLTALWGLVPDNEDGWTYLPLKLGLQIGASRLLWVAAHLHHAGAGRAGLRRHLRRARAGAALAAPSASIRVLCHAAPTLAPAGRRSPRPRPAAPQLVRVQQGDRQGLHARRGHQRPRRRRRRAGRRGRGRPARLRHLHGLAGQQLQRGRGHLRRDWPAPATGRTSRSPTSTADRRSRPGASSTSPTRAASTSPATSRPAT